MSATWSRNRRRRGFTLLELLIAVALLGVLVSALYASYFAVLRSRERAAEGMESRRELGATLDLLRREVSSAVFGSGDKKLRFIVEDRDTFGRPASALEFATLRAAVGGDQNGSGISVVRYRLEDRGQKLMLIRAERDLLYEQAQMVAYPQMERIHSFLVECYDGSKWVKSWDSSLNGGLPRQVRVTVQVEEDGHVSGYEMLATPRMVTR